MRTSTRSTPVARNFTPVVLQDGNRRPFIVFAKGRTLYHAVEVAHDNITLVKLDTLRGLVPVAKSLQAPDEPYPVKRAASFYLNKTWRPVTKRAKAVLRGLVARGPRVVKPTTIVVDDGSDLV